MSCKKIFFGYFQGQCYSEDLCDQIMTFYYIFRSADPFKIKLFSFIMHHHKPECLVVFFIIDVYCDHSDSSKHC